MIDVEHLSKTFRVARKDPGFLGSLRSMFRREVGRLFTQSGGFGLAHLRLDRLDGPLLAGTAEVRPA